jgi:hypothetical protein
MLMLELSFSRLFKQIPVHEYDAQLVVFAPESLGYVPLSVTLRPILSKLVL